MIVGTVGHIDHGKTALVKALTGVETDRSKEEKARGITIDLGFAYARLLPERITGFIDAPGHERLVHTMLAGASGIDFALLAIAADDGVMPQTREHVAILDLLGISRGIVALTKSDLADAERRAAVTASIARLLARTGLAGAAIVPVSVVTGEGLDTLRTHLATAERATATRAEDAAFRLAVDRCFTLPGAGVVVTGTVMSGSIAAGDRVGISPSGLIARVRSVHAQNERVDRGRAGQRCALNLAGEGISKSAVSRGDVVLTPDFHAPTTRIDATVKVLASEPKAIGSWFSARLHHASAEIGVRLVPLESSIAPGESAFVQLVLDRPLAAAVGDHFVLRDVSAQRTIGGGRFLDLRAPARKRRTPERLAQLAAVDDDDASVVLRRLLAISPRIVDLGAFMRDRAVPHTQFAVFSAQRDLVVFEADLATFAISRTTWDRFGVDVRATLETFHADNPDLQGLGRERLRLSVEPRLPAKAFPLALQRLAQHGTLVLDGAFVRLPGHEVRLDRVDEATWAAIAPNLCGLARFRPPRVRDLASLLDHAEPDIRSVLKTCARLGRVDQIAPDHFFLRATTAEMVSLAQDAAAQGLNGEFTAAQFRDRTDNGRKVAIQILDFFDRHGVTLRRGDLRRINLHRVDLFGSHESEGRETSPVGRPDFKSGWGSETVSGGFDSHSLPPLSAAP